MDPKFSNNFNIFLQKIIPAHAYILKGDNKPEPEIKTEYLKKLSIKNKPFKKQNFLINSINIGLNNATLISNEKRTTFTETNHLNLRKIKEEKKLYSSRSDNKDDIIYNNNININTNDSLDKKSSEFLIDLFNQGVFPSEENKNVVQLTMRQKEKFKLEERNPFLFSFNTMHPFSIFYGTKYEKLVKKNNELKLPAPNFITSEDWCKPIDTSIKALFDGIEINDKSGFVITDPVVKKKFSGLIKDIIIQLLQVPLGHHISLNVKIFEPKTVLERYISIFSYANIFLLPASNSNLTSYERFKLIITFQLAGMHVGCQQLKPFNPFMGETFQGELPNGAKIYVENVTHKPLVARFLIIYKKKYEISGFWDLSVKTQNLGTEMIINQKGPIYIKFPELDECIVCHIPFVKAVNAMSETKRALLFYGNMVFVDVKNKLKAVIKFNFNSNKFHEIKGCTIKHDFPPNYKYVFDNEWEYGNNFKLEDENSHKRKNFKNKAYKYEIIDKIKGSYLEQLIIGEIATWDINKQRPEHITPVKHCIPSDGRFREDLIWLYRSFYCAKNEEEEENYRNISMKWKVMMEEFSRWERKNRVSYKDKMKI